MSLMHFSLNPHLRFSWMIHHSKDLILADTVILHNDNHVFLRSANKTTISISYRHWPYLLLKLIKHSYSLANKKYDNFFDSRVISLKLYSNFELTILNIENSLQYNQSGILPFFARLKHIFKGTIAYNL